MISFSWRMIFSPLARRVPQTGLLEYLSHATNATLLSIIEFISWRRNLKFSEKISKKKRRK